MLVFILSYHTIPFHYIVKVYFLFSTERQRVEPDERGVREVREEVQGRETVIRIYYLTKKSIFYKRKKEKKAINEE